METQTQGRGKQRHSRSGENTGEQYKSQETVEKNRECYKEI